MTAHVTRHAPLTYELRLGGHLDDHWSTWFSGLSVTRGEDGVTTLRGTVTDQAELHGLLAKVRDLGITLLSVKSIDTSHYPRPQPAKDRPLTPPSIQKDPTP